MDDILKNIANISGTYAEELIELTSEELETTIVTGLSVTKAADKNVWVDGALTYTITITNTASNDLEDPVFSDTLDPALVALIDGSVEYNGTPITYEYDAGTGLLTVELETIAPSGTGIVTFQVTQV